MATENNITLTTVGDEFLTFTLGLDECGVDILNVRKYSVVTLSPASPIPDSQGLSKA